VKTQRAGVAPTAHDEARLEVSVSVIVCAYTLDRWLDLNAAINGIAAQEVAADSAVCVRGDVQIVLVIDHNPALAERAAALPLRAQIVENDRTRGLSGARNAGVERAAGDIVLFLDDDAAPEAGWLQAHLEAFAEPTVIGTAGRVEPNWDGDGPPTWWPHEFDWVIGCSYTGLPRLSVPVRNPIGANMGFRRTAIEAAGGFSEELGRVGTRSLGCEETELAIRAARLDPNSIILSVPAAVCHHRVTQNRATWHYFWRRCWNEGRSKARVASSVGPRSATDTESHYLRSTLAPAVATSLSTGHLRRAAAMVGGAALTTAGYLSSRLADVGTKRWSPGCASV
jgi:GT2 family glycosyltransferase